MTDDFSPLSSEELWLCHLSCESWSEPERWVRYFGKAEEILGASITHLDKTDPVRRRVKPGKLAEVAEYVTLMGAREDSRWVLGKFEPIGVEFAVRHYRDIRGWPNSINWYFPVGFADNAAGTRAIRCLFECGNTTLSPFYGYSDTKNYPASKKKESGAVDVRAELPGVFWLTYFDAHYVTFIGKDKIAELQGVRVDFDGGATLELGESPVSTPLGLRGKAEMVLGPKLFVEPKDKLAKRPGQYALTFDQLRS